MGVLRWAMFSKPPGKMAYVIRPEHVTSLEGPWEVGIHLAHVTSIEGPWEIVQYCLGSQS